MSNRIFEWRKWKLFICKKDHWICHYKSLRNWIHYWLKWGLLVHQINPSTSYIFLHYWIRHWWKRRLHSKKNCWLNYSWPGMRIWVFKWWRWKLCPSRSINSPTNCKLFLLNWLHFWWKWRMCIRTSFDNMRWWIYKKFKWSMPTTSSCMLCWIQIRWKRSLHSLDSSHYLCNWIWERRKWALLINCSTNRKSTTNNFPSCSIICCCSNNNNCCQFMCVLWWS